MNSRHNQLRAINGDLVVLISPLGQTPRTFHPCSPPPLGSAVFYVLGRGS
jgi:hypothetical protein